MEAYDDNNPNDPDDGVGYYCRLLDKCLKRTNEHAIGTTIRRADECIAAEMRIRNVMNSARAALMIGDPLIDLEHPQAEEVRNAGKTG
jgi:hypothetical protein